MDQLRDFRRRIGLSQEKIAHEMGVSFSMYAKVEQGRAAPSRGFMEKLKKCYPEASIDQIFFAPNSDNIAVGREVTA